MAMNYYNQLQIHTLREPILQQWKDEKEEKTSTLR